MRVTERGTIFLSALFAISVKSVWNLMENQFSTHLLKILHLGRQYFIQVPIFLQNILPLKS